MAWIPDATQQFTITLLQEGYLSIVDISAPSEARWGETINVNMTFENTGNNIDNFMWEALDADVGTTFGSGYFTGIPAGGQDTASFSFTMPSVAQDLVVQVNTYHEEL